MNGDMYELVAIAMRYFFAALMALIALRAWKITITDSRRATELRRMSPQTGRCGEFVVVTGDGRTREGMRFPVIREGLIGASGKADVRLRSRSVRRSHVFFELTERGLRLRSNNHAPMYFAGRSRREVCLRDGGHITVGRVELLLVLNVPVEAPADEDIFFEGGHSAAPDSIFETESEAEERGFSPEGFRREGDAGSDGYRMRDEINASRINTRRGAPHDDMPTDDAPLPRRIPRRRTEAYDRMRPESGEQRLEGDGVNRPHTGDMRDMFEDGRTRPAPQDGNIGPVSAGDAPRAYSGPFHIRDDAFSREDASRRGHEAACEYAASGEYTSVNENSSSRDDDIFRANDSPRDGGIFRENADSAADDNSCRDDVFRKEGVSCRDDVFRKEGVSCRDDASRGEDAPDRDDLFRDKSIFRSASSRHDDAHARNHSAASSYDDLQYDPLTPERNDEFDAWLNSDDDEWDDEPEMKWEPQWEDGPRNKKRARVVQAGEEDDFFNI